MSWDDRSGVRQRWRPIDGRVDQLAARVERAKRGDRRYRTLQRDGRVRYQTRGQRP